MNHRAWLAALVLLLPAAPAAAQLERLTVPRGTIRVDIGAEFRDYETIWVNGTLSEEYGSPALGSDRIPTLAPADSLLALILNQPGARLSLGSLTARRLVTVGTLGLGAAYGITDRLSIFGRVPIVRARSQVSLALAPGTANAGWNPDDPTFGGGSLNLSFLADLSSALAVLQSKISNGDYSGAQLILAQTTLANGTTLRDRYRAFTIDAGTESPFLPLAGSAEGQALTGIVDGLRNTLTGLSVTSFTSGPALPTDTLTASDLRNFLINPSGPIASLAPSDTHLFLMGDIELGATFGWLDRWDRPGHEGGIRSSVSALVRLPTATLARPENLFGVGTGDKQTDVEVTVTTDLGRGRLGARLAGTYTRQLPATFSERVASPAAPFAPAGDIRSIRRDPGDILRLSVQPYFRVNPSFAFTGAIDHWRRGADGVTYASAGDSIPGVPASVLADGTAADATTLRGGIVFSNTGKPREGSRHLPVEASWSYEGVVASSKGRVPNARVMRAGLRVYVGAPW